MEGRLKHKVCIITGGASGLGKASAFTFAEEGADIILADVNIEKAEAVKQKIEKLGRRCLVQKTDVTSRVSVLELAAAGMEYFGKIDVILNCAGIARCENQWGGSNWRPMEELTEDDWDKIIEINLKGTFLVNQQIGIEMIKQNYGSIINVSSLSGVIAHKDILGHGAYSASKAGVIGLTRVLAVEWASYNIRVNSVSPGYMDTGMVTRTSSIDGLFEKKIDMTPMKRFGDPSEFARTALFLASEDSSYMTGQNIILDGGYSSW